MSESTEVANAIYYLASTIKSGICMLGITAVFLWLGSALLRGNKK